VVALIEARCADCSVDAGYGDGGCCWSATFPLYCNRAPELLLEAADGYSAPGGVGSGGVGSFDLLLSFFLMRLNMIKCQLF
jgi:hypothetical protein